MKITAQSTDKIPAYAPESSSQK